MFPSSIDDVTALTRASNAFLLSRVYKHTNIAQRVWYDVLSFTTILKLGLVTSLRGNRMQCLMMGNCFLSRTEGSPSDGRG